MSKHLTGTIMMLAALVSAGSALADAIDGSWCHADGRRMSINGPVIITPGGNRLQGQYSRHAFSYVVPTTETPAGASINMTLLNENLVHLRVGDPTTPAQVWTRCGPPIS